MENTDYVAQALYDQQRQNQDWYQNAATATQNQRGLAITLPATIALLAATGGAGAITPPIRQQPGYRPSQPLNQQQGQQMNYGQPPGLFGRL